MNPPRSTPDRAFRFLRPTYLVLAPVSRELHVRQPATVPVGSPNGADLIGSFDQELVPALPSLWYALHLPKTRFDLVDMSPSSRRATFAETVRHRILLAPASVLGHPALLTRLLIDGEPMIILCPDQYLEEASAVSASARFVLPPSSPSQFSQASLDEHWQTISRHWEPGWRGLLEPDATPPQWASDISDHGSMISLRRLRRLISHAPALPADTDPYGSVNRVLGIRTHIDALSKFTDRPDHDELGTEEARAEVEELFVETRRHLRVPLTLSLPGTAPRYRRFIREHGAALPPETANSAVEVSASAAFPDPPEVYRLLVAHQAAGRDSIGVVIEDPIPDAAFVALADLERHWATGHGPRRDKEARLRARLDAAMTALWTDELLAAIRSASRLDAFTNFPIGLLHPPGDTAPLAAQIPIAYHPVNPLTRALQLQLSSDRPVDLAKGMTVLIAECIPDSDPVGRVSRRAWQYAASLLSDPSISVNVVFRETLTKADLSAAMAHHRPEVIVISAHGIYPKNSNAAGIVIGSEVSIGDDLGPMTPMVILSACHSGPRGAGPVSIADLLLRAGAHAVLSTLVPVGAEHNSIFMTRLLIYMRQAIAGLEEHDDVLDLWHRVQSNSVILDILQGNDRLQAWGTSEADGTSPMVEFMERRSAGRLRTRHLYKDAESVILEIAAERGQGVEVERWLRTPGYVPESMMYTFLGDPSQIRLRTPANVSFGPD